MSQAHRVEARYGGSVPFHQPSDDRGGAGNSDALADDRPDTDLERIPNPRNRDPGFLDDQGSNRRVLAEMSLSYLQRVLEGFALISFESRRHHDADLAALLHRDQRVSEAESELSGLIKELLADAVSTGEVRTDVGLDELAVYCLHSLAAAGSMSSKAGVQRLVKVTLSGLSQHP